MLTPTAYSPAREAADAIARIHRASKKPRQNPAPHPGARPSGPRYARPWGEVLRQNRVWIEPYQARVPREVTRNRAVASACSWARRHCPYMEIASHFDDFGVAVYRRT